MKHARLALGFIAAIAGYVAGVARLADGDISLGCVWFSLSSLWIVIAVELWGVGEGPKP